MIGDSKHIFIISNEAWGEVWFSKHHYANELAKLGHSVYFVNPVNNWKITNLFNFKATAHPIKPNLNVINYTNNFPLRVMPKLFLRINDWLNFIKIRSFVPSDSHVLVWQFDVFRFVHFRKRKNIQRIYHVADPYMDKTNDNKIAKQANLIICTSIQYLQYYRSITSTSKVIYVPHGLSKDELKIDLIEKQNIQKKYNDFALLTGTIAHNVDIDLLLSVAKSNGNIVIIGPKHNFVSDKQKKWDELIELKNVHYIGPINGEELKNWVSASKFCLIAYSFDLLKVNFNVHSSLKFMNYLAQNKLVISTLNGEMESLLQKGIYFAQNKKEFIDYTKEAWKDKLDVDASEIEKILLSRYYPVLIDRVFSSLSSTIHE